MQRVVQVRRREKGREHYYQVGELELKTGDYCILEGERGVDYGQILFEPELLPDDEMDESLGKIIRKVTPEDEKKIAANRKNAKEAFGTCQTKIDEKELPMKLVAAEYSFDQSRLLFYFTAAGRVDFRELVKDLAGIFKTRIELRQIGVRDETRMMGGIGICGRPLCCAGWLHDFEPINIRMAKTQRLPLDPDKISGVCGRLLCCLKYEDDFYREAGKKLPKEGTVVITPQGEGKVVGLLFLQDKVMVEMEDENTLVFSHRDIKIKK